MKVSYNWLKDYLNFNANPEEIKQILTNTGLEVEGKEEFESVKGGMEGVVIGKVLEARKHEKADRLTVTKVDIGEETPLHIVCGAPNVAENQKVVVAKPGTTLYKGDESLKIKKTKLKGEPSEGMICAEDEVGLGDTHEGIIVLDDDAPVGTPAADYFNIERDTVFEIDLTPNRADGTSHFGVGLDLAAYYKFRRNNVELQRPDVSGFQVDTPDNPIEVEIADAEGCKRYSGVTLTGITVGESPDWIKNRLKAIGVQPINNVVDITNFVLYETGHPLHAFDVDKITGQKIIIDTLKEGTQFKALDESVISLSNQDLMICNEKEGMCIAGVFGGLDSGVKESTTSVFLESAYFDPVYIRKTAKRHDLHTDAAYRFERGADPNMTIYALKRAALLIKDIAGGYISSEIVDEYPDPISDYEIHLRYKTIRRLLGIEIPYNDLKQILTSLEIKIHKETEEGIIVHVPPFRVDVTREADVVEEILRIYGYNKIGYSNAVKSTLTYSPKPDEYKLSEMISEFLTANGFYEGMTNTLTNAAYYKNIHTYKEDNLVYLSNPLSSDLNVLRQTVLFGHLESVARNQNFKTTGIKLYEFGNIQYMIPDNANSANPMDKYAEEKHLALTVSGRKTPMNWRSSNESSNYYHLKHYVDKILTRLNYNTESLKKEELDNDIFAYGLLYKQKKHPIVRFGAIKRYILDYYDIENDVFFAEFFWDNVIKNYNNEINFKPLSRFPAVKRDLALLIDKNITYEQIKEIAYKTERNLLNDVTIFDVYEGEQIEKGKKSYAISFTLQDETKTLKEKHIDKVMEKLMNAYKEKLSAEIR